MTKRSILPLSEDLIQKIAAGEVIEGPFSVVKELVENSIDADASKIVIEILGGGFHSIKVSDNGCGIEESDLPLALMRHATSKIYTLEELEKVPTLGFRGEGLCSIATTSRMKLISRTEKNSFASMLCSEGGKISEQKKCSAPVGTSIEAASLFFNLPARRKFQKSPNASTAEIHKQLIKLALGYPSIHFIFYANEKKIFDLPSADLGARLSYLIEDFTLEKMIPIDEKGECGRVHGYLVSPEISRKNRLGQYLFAYQRPISSLAISSAIKEGYGTRIDLQSHPLFALYLEPPFGLFDVNVHPQKLHVRFAEEKKITAWLCNLVFKQLNQKSFPGASFSLEPSPAMPWMEPALPSPIFDWTCKEDPHPSRSKGPELSFTYHVKGLFWQNPFLLFESYHEQTLSLYLADFKYILSWLMLFEPLSQEDQPTWLEKLAHPLYIHYDNPESPLVRDLAFKGVLARPFSPSQVLIEAAAPWIDLAWLEENFAELVEHPAFLKKKTKISTLRLTKESAESLIDFLIAKGNSAPHSLWKKITLNDLESLLHAQKAH